MEPFSIVIPAYNEEKGIQEVITRCREICRDSDEIIVVNDGSVDRTESLARAAGVYVITHPHNKGKAGALFTGIRAAKHNVIVTIDGDATYPPRFIPELVKGLDTHDLVVGSRFLQTGNVQLPAHRKWANILGAHVVSLCIRHRVSDVTSGLRAFRKDWVLTIPIQANGLDFEAELTGHAVRLGARYQEVPIQADHRKGQSSLRFFRDTIGFFRAALRGRYSK